MDAETQLRISNMENIMKEQKQTTNKILNRIKMNKP